MPLFDEQQKQEHTLLPHCEECNGIIIANDNSATPLTFAGRKCDCPSVDAEHPPSTQIRKPVQKVLPFVLVLMVFLFALVSMYTFRVKNLEITKQPSHDSTLPTLSIDDFPGMQSADVRIGLQALHNGNYARARRYLFDVRTFPKFPFHDIPHAKLLMQYGIATGETNDLPGARYSLIAARTDFENSKTNQGDLFAAECNNSLGLMYLNYMMFEESKNMLRAAQKVRDKIGTEKDKAESELSLCKWLNRIDPSDKNDATSHVAQTLQVLLASAGDDVALKTDILNELGLNYLRQHQLKQAKYFYEQAADVGKQLPLLHPLLSDNLLGLGTIDFQENSPIRAKEHFERALKIRQEIYGEDTLQCAEIYTHLGYLYASESPLDKAKYYKAKYYFARSLRAKLMFLGSESAEYQSAVAAYKPAISKLDKSAVALGIEPATPHF